MAQFRLMDDDTLVGVYELEAKVFSTGNTGYQATGQLTIRGESYNVNCLIAKKKNQAGKTATAKVTFKGMATGKAKVTILPTAKAQGSK